MAVCFTKQITFLSSTSVIGPPKTDPVFQAADGHLAKCSTFGTFVYAVGPFPGALRHGDEDIGKWCAHSRFLAVA